MTEQINLDCIAVIYDGDYVSSVPNTYKAFLETLRDKAGLTNEDFCNKTVWRGDFPITCKKDYIKAIRRCKDEGIMQIDLVSNELDEKEGINEKDYNQFFELKEPEEPIIINIDEEDNKEDTIYINSIVNEFYAKTEVTQYYKNNNNKPVELSIIYPLKKEINFKKFSININGKKSVSKIFEKEKVEEKYSDAIASGNVGIFSKYNKEDSNSYSITIGNIEPKALIELTSEFIQFITSNDMSFCFSVMTSYPTFSDGISRNSLKNINGKILLKTHSKITRLVNQNFTIDKHFKREFNEDNTSCNIEFKISNESKEYNSVLNLIFRTEKMNEPYLLSQYNSQKDETSYIFGMIHDQKPIPVPDKPDTDINISYSEKYENNEKTDTPSLFIFLVDQSGSMAGSSIKLVSESLLFFLQSLPKDSYFQIIGFGSTYEKINDKPLLYNKENVKNTMDIIKNLKANLGGTDISSPLKEIFNSKDYDEIKLARNLFILTDGEVNNSEECLGLIKTHSDKFKVHAIGIGSSFDKQLIQNAGIQGRGTYHFVTNVSDVNSIIIESLSKCLRNYILDAKLSLNEIKPEYEFIPKMNFIYPDEILNYYFILKGKDHDKIQINFENTKKNENYLFTKEKIIREIEGDIIGQIIIGNKLKNEENMEEETIVKLSKEYQILSKKTSLFAVAENEENNKIGELKQITKKKKEGIFDGLNIQNNMVNKMSNLNSLSLFNNESGHLNFMKASPNIGFGGMNNNYMSFGANKNYQRNMMSANYDMAYSDAPKMCAMMAKKSESDNSDSDNNDKKEYKSSYKAKEKSARYMEEKEADYLMGANYDMEECDDECDDREGSSPIKACYKEVKMEEKEEPK